MSEKKSWFVDAESFMIWMMSNIAKKQEGLFESSAHNECLKKNLLGLGRRVLHDLDEAGFCKNQEDFTTSPVRHKPESKNPPTSPISFYTILNIVPYSIFLK